MGINIPLHPSLTRVLRFFMANPAPDIEYLFGKTPETIPVSLWAQALQNNRSSVQDCYVTEFQHLKTKRRKRHEFLKITVIYFPTGATTSFLVDREVDMSPEGERLHSAKLGSHIYSGSTHSSTHSTSSLSKDNVPASDRVRVCNIEQDLANFTPYDKLSTLTFSNSSFPLIDLTILLDVVHKHAPEYDLIQNQCYWFAHAIFFSAKNIFQGAEVSSGVDTRGDWMRLVISPENSEEAIEEEFHEARRVYDAKVQAMLKDNLEVCTFLPTLCFS
jgi:hypothetical protein